jgi:uncharacterized protein (DUF486 family)
MPRPVTPVLGCGQRCALPAAEPAGYPESIFRSAAVEKVWPVLLLVASNGFMTVAWYGHLKFKSQPLWLVMQEAITLLVFVGFAWAYFDVTPNWRTGLAVLLVMGAVAIVPRKEV